MEAGLPIEQVRRLDALERTHELASFEDAGAAGAYASFLGTLLPHYAALGLDVPLTPEVFESLRKTTRKREDLAVLAVCLMKHHASADPETAGPAIARLDATLGLFQRRPAEAASILSEALRARARGRAARRSPISRPGSATTRCSTATST